MRWDPRTQAYVQRRTTEGLSKKEILRCLKRLIARELYHVLCQPLALAHHERDETAPADQPGQGGAVPRSGRTCRRVEGVTVEHAQRSKHERR